MLVRTLCAMGFLLLVCRHGVEAKGEDTPKAVAKAIKTGLANGDGVGDAFERAAALKGKFDDKAMQPVVKALGRAFKQPNKAYQILTLKTLAGLKVAGSYAQFQKMLKIPKKVTGRETRAVLLRAIDTAGALGEEAAVPDLERLLGHPDVSFARRATWALKGFRKLPKKKKEKLLQRLQKALRSLERQSKDKKPEVKERAKTLVPELKKTLEELKRKDPPKKEAAPEDKEKSKVKAKGT